MHWLVGLLPISSGSIVFKGDELARTAVEERALVLEPELLILDEPCEGIQPNVVSEIGDIVIRLNRELGLTVLIVEQKLKFARRVADGFTILDRGRNVAMAARHVG